MATQEELAAMFEGGSADQSQLAAMFEQSKPVEQETRTLPQELMRQLGLTGRAAIEGVGAIPNAIGDVVGLGSSRGLSNLLTRIGMPSPETETEKLSNAVVQGGASALLPIGVGAKMAQSAPGAVRGVGQMLASEPGKQVMYSGVGSGAAEMAKESGANSLGQFGAGISASLLAALLGRSVAPIANRVAQVADTAVMPGGATRAAGRVAVDTAGERAGAVSRALRSGEPVETAAQAAVPAGSAEFAGLEQMVAGRNPSTYGPDGSIIKTQEEYINQLWKDLNASTKALREAELGGANVAGSVGERLRSEVAQKKVSLAQALQTGGKAATESAQQGVLARTTSPRLKSIIGRTSGEFDPNSNRSAEWAGAAEDAATIAAQRRAEALFKESQLNSITAHGMKPLTTESIIGSIDSKMTTPGLRSSDVAQTVLGSFKEKILANVGENGIIDSRDLYTIRKEMGNKIKALAVTERLDKAMTEGLVRDVQKSIDEAIGSASGSLRKDGGSAWTDYLQQFSAGAKRIEGITDRAEVANRMGNAGREQAQRTFNADEVPITIPNLLSRPVMVTNAIIHFLEGRGGQLTSKELSELMLPQNKDKLAALMEKEIASRKDKKPLGNALMRAIAGGAYGAESSQ